MRIPHNQQLGRICLIIVDTLWHMHHFILKGNELLCMEYQPKVSFAVSNHYSFPWRWKGVSATLLSGRYTLSYPRGRIVPNRVRLNVLTNTWNKQCVSNNLKDTTYEQNFVDDFPIMTLFFKRHIVRVLHKNTSGPFFDGSQVMALFF